MKIILSRKGFDSQNGGRPSPILPDGRLVSLPIPSDDSIRFSNIKIDENKTYYDLMIELGIRSISKPVSHGRKAWYPLTNTEGCHLDPDINSLTMPHIFWKPLFGQIKAAQTHLEKQEVHENALFLFFGTFQETFISNGSLQFDSKESEKHIVFGYLQVEKIIRKPEDVEDWMKYHSHCDSNRNWKPNNTVYVGRETLTWNQGLPGAGVFNFNKELVLTADGHSKSVWNLRPFFKGKLSRHKQSCWEGTLLRSVPIGQEIVAHEEPEIEQWAKELIEQSSRWSP